MGFFNLTNQQLIDAGISVAMIVIVVIIGRPLLKFVLDRVLARFTKHTKTTLDDDIVEAVRSPMFWIIFLTVVDFAVRRLDFLNESLGWDLAGIFFTLYALFGFIIAYRLVNVFSQWYMNEIAPTTETDVDDQLVPFLRRIAHIFVVIIALIIVLGYFNIEVSGLLTTLGIGSLAIALAAQAALSDTISGFLIMIDRPFRIGDRIEIQALNTWGDVADIGLRSTRIRTRDNRMVIVPNSVIAKSLVVNHSFPDSQYRIQIHIGIAYGSDLELARTTLVEAVKTVPGVIGDNVRRPVEALFLEFGDSALDFRVRWWIESYVDTRRIFDKVNTAMYKALNEAGVEVPFPQQDVYIRVADRDIDNVTKALGK